MSRLLILDNLSDKHLEKLSKDLQVTREPSKYAFNAIQSTITLYDVDGNNIYIPFAYDMKAPRPERAQFPVQEIHFHGHLREEQKKVKTEAIAKLNSNGSVIIASFPGFGKCLQKNTPILMYDGTIKMVQNIIPGNQIMGDDSTPRNVLSICTGHEQMYKVLSKSGDSFGANESHILSLKMPNHKNIVENTFTITFLKRDPLRICTKQFESIHTAEKFCESIDNNSIVDISIREYMLLDAEVKKALKLYKVPVVFPYKKTIIDPYIFGLWIAKDEKVNSIPHEFLCNTREKQLKVLAGIIDASGYYQNNFYRITPKNTYIINDILFLCRSLGFYSRLEQENELMYIYGYGCNIPVCHISNEKDPQKYTNYEQTMLVSDFELVPIQDDNTYYGFTIDGNHRFVLGDFTVTHNTAMGIYIASKISMKTLILCHRVVLIKQWEESIRKFCPTATIQTLTPKSKMQDVDFYIINAANVSKHPRSFYKEIGFTIVDECLPGNTLVLLDDKKMRRIGDIHNQIQNGKMVFVLSYNELTKIFERKKVTFSWKRPIEGKTLLTIVLSRKKRDITCTSNHKILTFSGYKPARDIVPGELILSYTGNEGKNHEYLEVQSVDMVNLQDEKYVYDLEVQDNHNFILGNEYQKGGPVVHNCHLIMAEKLSNCMRSILPRYLLGLSATPYRTDGLNVLMDMYFGKHKIERKLFRAHTVYRVNTGFKPDVKLNRMGKVDWGSVIDSTCSNKERNELIVHIIHHFKNRVFLVLCKRIEQANYLVTRLEEKGEDVTSLIGKNQEYEQKSRILVGTTGKVGVGFDHPRLNTLLLASDVEQYFIQYLGRVFRTEDVEPIIFDLVDDYGLLQKHFRTRSSVYVEHGGVVKDFRRDYPNFGK